MQDALTAQLKLDQPADQAVLHALQAALPALGLNVTVSANPHDKVE
jgi:hypothetical protein